MQTTSFSPPPQEERLQHKIRTIFSRWTSGGPCRRRGASRLRLALSPMLQRYSHSSEDGDGPPRPERLRVRNGRASHELPGLDQAAGGIITLIENVLNVAKNLHLLVILVGRVQAK